ncbi:MAG: oligosaccharide flippase family protein [Candidatus Neomarinimicrobiota bacterium]|nr:oligosaccharide flippase family protein [Candidatus Neomarinimicrobiota bacterium]
MNPQTLSLYKQLFGDSYLYFLTKIIPGITGLLSVIVFMRWVGPDGYGQFTLLLSFVMATGALSSGWLNQALLRYFSKDENKVEFPRIIFQGTLISILTGFFILLAGYYFFLDLNIFGFIVIYLFLVSIILFRLKSSLLQAGLKPKKVTQISVIQSILGLVIPVIFLIGFNHFLSIIAGISIAYLLTGYQKNQFQPNDSIAITTDRRNLILLKYFSFGIPLSFRMFLGLLIPFLDRWFIMFFLDKSVTGFYAGYSEIIMRVFSIILFPITLAIHPRATHLWNHGKERESLDLVKKGIWIQTGIFFLAFMIFILFEMRFFQLTKMLIPGLNTDFAVLGMPIFLSGFLWQVSLLIHKPLELSEKPKKMIWAIVFSLGVVVFGNALYLPRFGVLATAYTSVASAMVYIISILIFIKFDNNSRTKNEY